MHPVYQYICISWLTKCNFPTYLIRDLLSNDKRRHFAEMQSLLLQINDHGFHAAAGGANQLAPGVRKLTALGLEIILTFILVFVVFAASATDYMQAVPGSTRRTFLPVWLCSFFIGYS